MSPKQAAKKGKNGLAQNGEDLGEAVTRKDQSKKKTTSTTPPQTKKRRLSSEAASTGAGSTPNGKGPASPLQPTKGLDGFAAFNQMKAANGEKQTTASPSPKKQPAANGKANGDQQPQKAKASPAPPQGKAKEARKSSDAMEQEHEEDGFDFARMSIDDLFAQFDDEGKEKSVADKKGKSEKQAKSPAASPAAKTKPAPAKETKSPVASPAKTKLTPTKEKLAPVVPAKPVETAVEAKVVEAPKPVEIQPIVESNGAGATATTPDGAGKKKRRRRRNKNAANGGEANGVAASPAKENGHPQSAVANGNAIAHTPEKVNTNTPSQNGSSNSDGTPLKNVPEAKKVEPAMGQKRKREEQKEVVVEETKKHKPDDATPSPAPTPAPTPAPVNKDNNANASGKEKEKVVVVGSGKNDKVLSFDDLVFRRGGKGKDLVDSSPLGKGKKASDGAKEWEQYLKLNTKDNQLETKNGASLLPLFSVCLVLAQAGKLCVHHSHALGRREGNREQGGQAEAPPPDRPRAPD